MPSSSPIPLEADKTGDACRRNAQRSTGPQTPSDGVAAILDQGQRQPSGRGPQTSGLKPIGGWDDTPAERPAVAPASRFQRVPRLSGGFLLKDAIEFRITRAIYRLPERHGLSHPQPSEEVSIDQN